MTPDQLNDALDAMEAAAGDDQGKRPGLIEVATDRWIGGLDALQTAKPKTLVDGIRIRDIKVAVGSGYNPDPDPRRLWRAGRALPRSVGAALKR